MLLLALGSERGAFTCKAEEQTASPVCIKLVQLGRVLNLKR